MAMPAIRRRWTIDAVRELTREDTAWPRYELIGGELFVTPAPRTMHQRAVAELWRLLDEYVTRDALGEALMSPADLELRPGTMTQPDVFVVPAETQTAGAQLEWPDVKSLLLAVEVLSPASLHTDRVVKRDFYLDAGVEAYWIVDLDARVFEVWQPHENTPVVARDRLAWSPREQAPLIIDVTAFFTRIDEKARRFGQS